MGLSLGRWDVLPSQRPGLASWLHAGEFLGKFLHLSEPPFTHRGHGGPYAYSMKSVCGGI